MRSKPELTTIAPLSKEAKAAYYDKPGGYFKKRNPGRPKGAKDYTYNRLVALKHALLDGIDLIAKEQGLGRHDKHKRAAEWVSKIAGEHPLDVLKLAVSLCPKEVDVTAKVAPAIPDLKDLPEDELKRLARVLEIEKKEPQLVPLTTALPEVLEVEVGSAGNG